ncbi:MAG: hypothetical protein NTY15_07005 [Planctomycetota bacterium]|nr:hypothetical protein [Planctomycetota bacterium]
MTYTRIATGLVPIVLISIAWSLAAKGYLAHYLVLIGFAIFAFLCLWAWRRTLLGSLPTGYQQLVQESSSRMRVRIGRALAVLIGVTMLLPLAVVGVMYLKPGMSESWKTFSICLFLIAWASKIPLAVLITEWHLFRGRTVGK